MIQFLRFSLSFSLSLLILPVTSSALTVISDIDDTLRISDVIHFPKTTTPDAWKDIEFTGASTLLKAVAKNSRVDQIFYLSARSHYQRKAALNFLSKNYFPEGELHVRDKGDRRQALEFKLEKIRTLIQKSSDSIVLIGDDTQDDPEVYQAMEQEFSGRILGIYIHKIKGKRVSRNAYSYLIPYELGVQLHSKSLITTSDLARVKTETLQSRNSWHLIPTFQICPKLYRSTDLEIQEKVRTICKSRI